jgi:PhnB protein
MEKTAKKNKSVRAVPEGFETITPYLVLENAQQFIDFVKNAFNGEVTFISNRDDKKIMHATVKIGTSTIMLSDTMEGMGPQTAMLYLYLDDADAVFKKAIQAKATSIRELKTEFYGDRAGAVKDEWGNVWWIATHVEDVDPEELERRSQKAQEEQQRKGAEVHPA